MMKLTEMKSMIKKDFNERYIYNLERCEIEVITETYGIINVYMNIGTKRYCIATESIIDMNCRIDNNKVDKVNKYVDKVRKSFEKVEEIDVKVIRIDN